MYVHNWKYSVFIFVSLLLTVAEVPAQYIVGSNRHTSMLCDDGSIYSWTSSEYALLGIGSIEPQNEPVRTLVENSRQIFCGDFSMVSVDKEGDVWAWGNNLNNKFGMPSWEYLELTPRRIPHFSGIRKALVNGLGTICLLKNGQVRVSGYNASGQYGNGTTITLDSGNALVTLDSIVDIFCAANTAYAVHSDGMIYAWGGNVNNSIDSSTISVFPNPKPFLQTKGVISVSGSFGGYSDITGCMRIVTIEGDVYVWGQNDSNQLGYKNERWIITPRKLTLPKKAKAVSGGAEHTIVLYEDGTVATFGDNEKGQLGNPSVTNTASPVTVNGLTDIVAIGAGIYTSFAFARDGTVYGWGDNEYQQLNVDGATKYYQARQIPLPCTPLSVPAQAEPIELVCTPNPVYDILNIAIEPQTTTVEVYSMHGRIVHSEHIMIAQPQVMINMSSEPSGIYAVVRNAGNKRTTELIVKM